MAEIEPKEQLVGARFDIFDAERSVGFHLYRVVEYRTLLLIRSIRFRLFGDNPRVVPLDPLLPGQALRHRDQRCLE